MLICRSIAQYAYTDMQLLEINTAVVSTTAKKPLYRLFSSFLAFQFFHLQVSVYD